MVQIEVSKIRFIKLGESGEYEKDCLINNTIRIGYSTGDLDKDEEIHQQCLKGNWKPCEDFWFEKAKSAKKASNSATDRIRQIKEFYNGDEKCLWITFYGRKLYWAFCDSTVHLDEDQTRWRKVKSNGGKWSCLDRKGNELTIDNLDGRVTKVQGYRGTICGVEMEDYLIRRINGEVIEEITEAENAYNTLINSVEKLIKGLWWGDFELLVDLVFSRLGWQRYSVLGKTQKGIDLDLYSPSTEDRVFVQIKSNTNIKQLDEYISKFKNEYNSDEYSKMYYIYHSGLENINEDQVNNYPAKGIKLINCHKMAELVIRAGLVEWLIKKRS